MCVRRDTRFRDGSEDGCRFFDVVSVLPYFILAILTDL